MKFALSLILTFLAQTAFSQVPSDSLPAVIKNPLAMTISSVLIQPSTEDQSVKDTVTIWPKRSQTPLLERAGKARFSYRLQKSKTAPVIFIVPGVGGDYRASSALYLAEKLYGLGYSTITLDSPFSWFFAVSGSEKALPGFNATDAQDLYRVMLKVKAKLVARHRIAPRSFAVTGYSLGALHALFVKNIDNTEKQFGFNKVLLINPPMDMLHAVRSLDGMFARGQRLSQARKDFVFGRLIDVGGDALMSKKPLGGAEGLQVLFDRLKFNNSDLAYVISLTFRGSLRDTIFASQQVNDLGLLKHRATKYRMNARLDEAGRISFIDYMNRAVFPAVKSQKAADYTLENLNQESSIYQFAEMIREDQGIFLSHSQDDFLMAAGDAEWAKETFGPRAVIFPYGGHCGAIAFPQFNGFLQKIFAQH